MNIEGMLKDVKDQCQYPSYIGQIGHRQKIRKTRNATLLLRHPFFRKRASFRKLSQYSIGVLESQRIVFTLHFGVLQGAVKFTTTNKKRPFRL